MPYLTLSLHDYHEITIIIVYISNTHYFCLFGKCKCRTAYFQ